MCREAGTPLGAARLDDVEHVEPLAWLDRQALRGGGVAVDDRQDAERTVVAQGVRHGAVAVGDGVAVDGAATSRMIVSDARLFGSTIDGGGQAQQYRGS